MSHSHRRQARSSPPPTRLRNDQSRCLGRQAPLRRRCPSYCHRRLQSRSNPTPSYRCRSPLRQYRSPSSPNPSRLHWLRLPCCSGQKLASSCRSPLHWHRWQSRWCRTPSSSSIQAGQHRRSRSLASQTPYRHPPSTAPERRCCEPPRRRRPVPQSPSLPPIYSVCRAQTQAPKPRPRHPKLHSR